MLIKKIFTRKMENIIENWISSDKGISDILRSIDLKASDEKEAAEKAFYQIGSYLKLPLQPADITEEEYDSAYDQNLEPQAVLIELAMINYMFSDVNIKGNVMLALYNVHHKCCIDFYEVVAIHFGDESRIPAEQCIYFFGDSIDARLSFTLPKGVSWVEAGAKLMVKVIRHIKIPS